MREKVIYRPQATVISLTDITYSLIYQFLEIAFTPAHLENKRSELFLLAPSCTEI